MASGTLYYFIISISIIFFSCSNFQEKVDSFHTKMNPLIHNDSDQVIKNDTGGISGLRVYTLMEIERERDSVKRVEAQRLPVSFSYEYREDVDFNQYVSISLKNNTKEVISSVQLNISSGNQLIEELKKRVTINPGQTKTIKYFTDNGFVEISVLKYYGIKSGVQYNGIDDFDKTSLWLDDKSNQIKKRDPLYK